MKMIGYYVSIFTIVITSIIIVMFIMSMIVKPPSLISYVREKCVESYDMHIPRGGEVVHMQSYICRNDVIVFMPHLTIEDL